MGGGFPQQKKATLQNAGGSRRADGPNLRDGVHRTTGKRASKGLQSCIAGILLPFCLQMTKHLIECVRCKFSIAFMTRDGDLSFEGGGVQCRVESTTRRLARPEASLSSSR
jgi:hypothetical protein